MKSLIVLLFLGLIFKSNTFLAKEVTQTEKNFAIVLSQDEKVVSDVVSDITFTESVDFSNVYLAEKVRCSCFINSMAGNSVYCFDSVNIDVGKQNKESYKYNSKTLPTDTHQSFRRSRDGLMCS